jgi:GNAT superfamily N-acetyltransferase
MIREITYEECLPLWQLLWASRVSPIEPTSAMAFPWDVKVREYTKNIGTPTFLGYFDGDLLVGVNSFHQVDNMYRSRGLYVLGSHRKKGIGEALLRATIQRAPKHVWSYPKMEALSVYQKAGFNLVGEPVYDEVEGKTNQYVCSL